MKKNCRIHLWAETELKDKLTKESQDMGLSLSELCRHKLKEMPTLNKIEFMIERFEALLSVSQKGSRLPKFSDDKFYKLKESEELVKMSS